MKRHQHVLSVLLLAAATLLNATNALAQSAAQYPQKQIHLVVPFPPAGPTDVVARLIAQKLTERWGQTVVVENRAGAGGSIGAAAVARAAPDGYTLVMGSTANMAVNVTLMQGSLTYDPLKDFVPVNLAAVAPNLLVLTPNHPATNVRELIAAAKANPGSITYASGGSGTPSHLAAELFKAQAGIQMLHVPYKGSIPALSDVMSGQVTLMFDSMASALPFAQSGKLKGIAQTGSKRAAAASNIPTVRESGLAEYDVSGWFGILAPAQTPRDIVDKLSSAITDILRQPDVRERYRTLGLEPGPERPEDFGAFMKSEITKWADVIVKSGTKRE
jgi:tripartite-type tricarboxylate transporter receptor subunit TctC